MDIKYLNYILTIAKKRNMTKAAEELFVSQSSLSQYLSRLEQELGTPLFIRSKGELTLTEAGILYTEAAERVVQIQKKLYQDIRCLDQKEHIRIGVTSNFGLRMLSELIPPFKELYPNVSIEITETGLPGLKKLLMDEAVDLGLAAEVSTVPFGEYAQVLRQEEILFAVPKCHPYAQTCPEGSLSVKELISAFSEDNFVLSKKGSSLRMRIDQFFEDSGWMPSAFCETNSISTTRTMVARNGGVAFIGESCSVNRDQIAYYHLNPALFRLNLVIRRKGWNLHEPERFFMDRILSYFSEQTESPYLAENFSVSRQ